MGQLEALVLGLMNFLGIPPGITVRRYYNGSRSDEGAETQSAKLLRANEFIKNIIDITADDVCIGASPFYLYGGDDGVLSERLLLSYKSLVSALNVIAKWAAIDLLGKGWSIYSLQVQDVPVTNSTAGGEKLTRKIQKASLVPVIVDNVRFYMKKNGEIVTLIAGKEAKEHLIFPI